MRVSLVILFALVIVVVNSATIKTRGTTKAPQSKSAYAYLRTVRGKKSCASGTCPFWERHGRSFASLRCYSQQYQECTCLHRMCFSSCMFTRDECNREMVSCLQQICPRCMAASSLAMCQVYDSMAERVAQALSVFACYPCCPNLANSSPMNTTSINGQATTTTIRPANVGNTITTTASGAGSATSTITITQNSSNGPNGGNTGTNQVNGVNQGATNGNGGNFGGVFPGSGMTGVNANMRNNSNSINRPNQNQQIRQVTRPTTRRVVTTRRIATTIRRQPVTTRRVAATTTRQAVTVRGNTNQNAVRTPVSAQKKPQTNN